MGQVRFIVPRLVIGYFACLQFIYYYLLGVLQFIIPQEKAKATIDFLADSFVGISVCRVLIQLLCSYSTLPLYAIVTQVRKYLIIH
jgi:hypothetical protein